MKSRQGLSYCMAESSWTIRLLEIIARIEDISLHLVVVHWAGTLHEHPHLKHLWPVHWLFKAAFSPRFFAAAGKVRMLCVAKADFHWLVYIECTSQIVGRRSQLFTRCHLMQVSEQQNEKHSTLSSFCVSLYDYTFVSDYKCYRQQAVG